MRTREAKLLIESLDTAFKFLKAAAIVVLIGILFSGITYVRSDEVAFVLRFGKLVGNNPSEQIHGPGLLFAWPYLIDQVIRVPVKRVQIAQITAFSGSTVPVSTFKGTDTESQVIQQLSEATNAETLNPMLVGYCLTGEQNIVHVRVTAKFVVKDPIAYALHVQDATDLLLNCVASSVTKSIGAVRVDSVLAEGKRALADKIASSAQKTLDEANTGISLVAIEFKEVKPPQAVAEDFQDVVNAYVEKRTKSQEAQAYREKELPKAEADRNRMISDARAFSAERTSRAKGEASTFRSVYAEYKTNPQVVRERLYYEAVEKMLTKAGPRVVTPKQSSHTHILLPLSQNKVTRSP